MEDTIPIIGALSFSALKFLPLGQRIYEGITLPRLAKSKLANLLDIILNPPFYESKLEPKQQKLEFSEKLELKNISFCYKNKNIPTLKNINLIIHPGERVGIVGQTGSGKSTLVDLIMGLIEPTKGSLYIDKINLFDRKLKNIVESWQELFIHVPQNIFLTDSTIAENIAFGIEKENINYEKLYEVVRKSCLLEFINKLENGLETKVGERGIRLSGGQRQRIGIARALYKEAKVIFLDEATSSLDIETEKSVMKSFQNLRSDITLIIIAHRIQTLEICDSIYEVSNSQLIKKL